MTDEDGYDGPAQLLNGAETVDVVVTLRGHFDPISGRYSWYGRVASGPDVAALVAQGVRTVVLRTPHRDVETRLSDVDPWGRPRVEGFGAAPFAVLDTVPRRRCGRRLTQHDGITCADAGRPVLRRADVPADRPVHRRTREDP